MCNMTLGSVIFNKKELAEEFDLFTQANRVTTAPKPPLIFGICGEKETGKNVTGALLSMIGYVPIAFADGVREEAARAIHRKQYPDLLYHFPQVLDDFKHCDISELWAKPTSARARRILQFWGTEYRRAADPEYWINYLDKRIHPRKKYAITDMRFPNEAQYVRDKGGIVLKVRRKTAYTAESSHASEQGVMLIDADYNLDNNKEIQDLANQLQEILAYIHIPIAPV